MGFSVTSGRSGCRTVAVRPWLRILLSMAALALGLASVCPCADAKERVVPVVAHFEVLIDGLEQPSVARRDERGRTVVVDGANHRVLLLAPTGRIEHAIGHRGAGVGEFELPLDAAIADGMLVIADTGNHRLVLLDAAGGWLRAIALAGLDSEHPAEPVAVTVQDGLAFWSDRTGHRVCRTRLDDGATERCFGQRGSEPGQFQFPFEIAQDRDGFLAVVDIVNARLQLFDKTGRFFSSVGRFGLNPGELFRPNGAAIATDRDIVFVSDSYFGTVAAFQDGEFVALLAGPDGQVLTLNSPTGLSYRDGELLVAESGANRVMRYTLDYRSDLPPRIESGPRDELSQKDCLVCHLSWANEAAPEVRAPDSQGALPEASFRMCYSCHNGAIMDSRLAIHRGAQHPVIYESAAEQARHRKAQPRKDKLPDTFPVTHDKQLLCTSCHTPHTDAKAPDTLYEPHRNAWLRVPNRGGDLCERCHASKAQGARPAGSVNNQPGTATADTVRTASTGRNHPLGIRFTPPPQPKAKGFPTNPELFKGLPMNLRRNGAALGHSDELICQTCHQVHGGENTGKLTVLRDSQGELCKECHPRQFSRSKEEAHKNGVHPVNVKRDPNPDGTPAQLWKGKPDIEEVTCATCHKVHQGTVDTALLPDGVRDAESLCKNCHERQHADGKEDAKRKGVHPVNAKLDEPIDVNGKRVETVGCLTCHAVHTGKPNTAALVETDRDGELCSYCHKHKQTVVGTDHDLRITAKDKPNAHKLLPAESGVCGACHSLHKGTGDRPFLFASRRVTPSVETGADKMDDSPFKRDALCLNCHQKDGIGAKRYVRHFSHPVKDVVLRSDPKVLPLLNEREEPKDFGAIACITCHEPHVWDAEKRPAAQAKLTVSSNAENLEGSNRDSFLRRKGVDHTFCIDCHGLEGLMKYKYFHDAKRSRTKHLEYLK